MHKITLKVERNGRLVERTFLVDGTKVSELAVTDPSAGKLQGPSRIATDTSLQVKPYVPSSGCKSCKNKR